MLNTGADRVETVSAAFAKLAQHFGMQRAYVLQYTEDDGLMHATEYAWSERGYALDMSSLDVVPPEELRAFYSAHDRLGGKVYYGMSDLPSTLAAVMARAQVNYMVQYKYYELGRLQGLISFDSCGPGRRKLDAAQAEELIRLSRILALYALKASPERHSFSLLNQMDQLPTYAYLVRQKTHHLVYANRAFLRRWPDVSRDAVCYRAMHGRRAPCADCPMEQLRPGRPHEHAQALIHSRDRENRLKVSASWVQNEDVGTLCFLNAIDVSEYAR